MPSLSEGLPVIGVQALAHALAIVASRAGGLAELVTDEINGRLSEVGDLEQYSDSLRWTLASADRLRELKKASRAKSADYDINRVADHYETLFAALRGAEAVSNADQAS